MQIKKSIFDKHMKILKEYTDSNTVCTIERDGEKQLRILAVTYDHVSMVDMIIHEVEIPSDIDVYMSNLYFKDIYNTFKYDKSKVIDIEIDNKDLVIYTDTQKYMQEIETDTKLDISVETLYNEVYESKTTEIIINNSTVDTFKKECNLIKSLGGHTYLSIENSTIRYKMDTDKTEYKMDYDLKYTIHSNCKIAFNSIGEVKTNLALTYKYLLRNIKKTDDSQIRISFGKRDDWFSTPMLYEMEVDGGYLKYIQAPMMYD